MDIPFDVGWGGHNSTHNGSKSLSPSGCCVPTPGYPRLFICNTQQPGPFLLPPHFGIGRPAVWVLGTGMSSYCVWGWLSAPQQCLSGRCPSPTGPEAVGLPAGASHRKLTDHHGAGLAVPRCRALGLEGGIKMGWAGGLVGEVGVIPGVCPFKRDRKGI